MSTDTRGITPYRKTHVRFDIDENTLRESPFALWRSAYQIAKGHSGERLSDNAYFLAPDAIVIAPWQEDPSNLHEKTDVKSAIVPLSDFDTIPGMVSRPTFRKPTDLTGVTVDSSVQTSGDNFYQKTVAAGGTWDHSLTPDIDAFGQITFGSAPNVTLDRIAVGKNTYPDNQAYLFRMVVPAAAPHYKQLIGAFYFGGPVTTTTDLIPSGVFSIEFQGDGKAILHLRKNETSGFTFVQVSSWQAFHRSNTTQVVYCRVWPHYAADGTPVIQFTTDTSGSVTTGSGNLFTSYFGSHIDPNVHVWYGWNPPQSNGSPSSPLPVTGHGSPRIDMSRPLRVPFQVSLLRHVANATIRDDDFTLDFFPTISNPVTLLWQSYVPYGCGIVGGLFDSSTDLELTSTDSGDGYITYTLNPGQYQYYASFTLSPDSAGVYTPLLYGYKVIRDGTIRALSPGEVSVPDTYPLVALRQISIAGPDKDLTHETCSATFEDPAANLSNINIRARVRTRIETEYDPNDSTLRSVLFDGFVDRADGKLKGTAGGYGLGQIGTTRTFPSPAWKQFDVSFSGVWRRLREKLTMQRIMVAGGDIDPITGKDSPYKVTDICRKLLSWCGFADAEIDVPDSPIRFYPGTGGTDEVTLEPLTEIGDAVAGFLHDYLGWFLIWDGNASTNGMIRAIQPPPSEGPYTALCNFTLDPAATGALPMRPESYGSVGWYGVQPGGPGTTVTNPTVRIRGKTFQTHVKPPEANIVHVTATGQVLPGKTGQYQLNQWVWNPKSYDFFVDGSGNPVNTADPNSPDYLGEMIPIVVVNTALGTQSAVDILCRRIYDVACHAQKWAMFEAPLALVIDETDTNQTKPRPLRYYDAVLVTKNSASTTWLVRSCNPFYRKDGIQMAHYELLAVT